MLIYTSQWLFRKGLVNINELCFRQLVKMYFKKFNFHEIKRFKTSFLSKLKKNLLIFDSLHLSDCFAGRVENRIKTDNALNFFLFYLLLNPHKNQSTYNYVKFYIGKFNNWIPVWEGIFTLAKQTQKFWYHGETISWCF